MRPDQVLFCSGAPEECTVAVTSSRPVNLKRFQARATLLADMMIQLVLLKGQPQQVDILL